jgi:hypothetical protein
MRVTRTPVRPRDDRRHADCDAASRAHLSTCSGPHQQASEGRTPPTSGPLNGHHWSTRRRVLLVAELASLAVLTAGATAHADTVVLAIAGSVDEVLTNIRNWLMGILAGLATVFLTIGGVRRVFGGGDPGEQEKSKEAFKAAGIGYALAALAPLVVTVLKGIVGA